MWEKSQHPIIIWTPELQHECQQCFLSLGCPFFPLSFDALGWIWILQSACDCSICMTIKISGGPRCPVENRLWNYYNAHTSNFPVEQEPHNILRLEYSYVIDKVLRTILGGFLYYVEATITHIIAMCTWHWSSSSQTLHSRGWSQKGSSFDLLQRKNFKYCCNVI